MTKPELLNEINLVKEKIRTKKSKLSEKEDNLDALEEFSVQCNNRVSSFENSVFRRKNKLFTFDELIYTVKIATKYKDKMTDMLTGNEYKNAVNQIDSLLNSVSTNKSNLKNEIIQLKDDIEYLNAKLKKLQYDYNNFPEEVENYG